MAWCYTFARYGHLFRRDLMNPLEIHSLLCRRDVPLACEYLKTLIGHSLDPIEFVFHDDGSLQPEDEAVLREALPGSRVIYRAEADEQMEKRLQNYPTLREFRRRDVFGLKLLDVSLLGEQDQIIYSDSDVWCFQPFRQVFALPSGCGALFMHDMDHSVCVRSWQLLNPQLRLSQFINAGFFTVQREAFDLRAIENFISSVRSWRPYFTEQTCWGLLAQSAGAHHWNPQQVTVISPQTQWTPDLVLAHVVSLTRQRFPAIRAQGEAFDYSNRPLPQFSSRPVPRLRAPGLFLSETQRIVQRVQDRATARLAQKTA